MAKARNNKPKTKINVQLPSSRLAAVVLAFIGMLCYFNTLGHLFTLDDFSVIKDNFVTKQGLAGIPTILTTDYRYGYWVSGGTLYRPLSQIMFAIEWALAPDSPFIGHFVNVALFGLTIFVLFYLMKNYLTQSSVWLSAGICLLFATHPMHAEVVANIKSRDEILGLLCSLGALYYYMLSYSHRGIKYSLLGFVLYLLAMFSKESAVTFLAVFPITAYFFTNAGWQDILKKSWPLVLPVVIYLIVRQSIIGSNISLEQTSVLDNFLMAADNPFTRMTSAVMMLGYYIKSFLFPLTLSHEYGFNQIAMAGITDWRFLLSLLVHVAMVWYILRYIKQKRLSVYGLLFYIITMSIVSNIFITIGTSYGDRLFYTPGLGLMIFVCAALYEYFLRNKQETSFNHLAPGYKWPLIVVSVLFASKTFSRNAAWYDSYTLYKTDIEHAPNSAKMRYHFALETGKKAMEETDAAKQKEWRLMAIAQDTKALEIFPKYNDVFAHLGLMYYHLKDYSKAINNYTEAIKLGAKDAKMFSNMGTLYSETGDNKKAMEYYKKAVELDPRFVDARRNLGCLMAINRDFPNAIKEFEKALEYDPNNADILFFMGSAYRDGGNPKKGNEILEEAYRLKPELRK